MPAAAQPRASPRPFDRRAAIHDDEQQTGIAGRELRRRLVDHGGRFE
jgi:hypothetical protein